MNVAENLSRVGVLHPGTMGEALAAIIRGNGAEVMWASAGRSERTRARATRAGLREVATVDVLVKSCQVIISVCPPHAAVEVAKSVAAHSFSGLYVDVNAIAPRTAREIAAVVERAGGAFVDGGICGGPPVRPGTTRIYLSGGSSPHAASLLGGGPAEVIVLDSRIGAASALKMAYAAWTKGTSALLVSIRALASREGVEAPLLRQWAVSQPELESRSSQAVSDSAHRAWRWVGEMMELETAFRDAGLPFGFATAASDVFRSMERYKDSAIAPTLEEATAAVGMLSREPTTRIPSRPSPSHQRAQESSRNSQSQ